MQSAARGLVAVALLFTLIGSGRGDETAEIIIHRAIDAAGGRRLARLRAVTWKGSGILHGPKEPIHFTHEVAVRRPDRARSIVRGQVGDRTVQIVTVLNASRGWAQIDHRTHPLKKEQLAEAREQRYADNVAELVDLIGTRYQLTALGESTLPGGQAVLGVKVSNKGHRDVWLFFDKKTGLLAKSEYRLKDDNNHELKQEAYFSVYKNFAGVRKPTRIVIQRDGKPYLEEDVTSYQLTETLPDQLFEQP